MTPDIDEIRQALAAATGTVGWDARIAKQDIVANAPTWLAACISEIERLRAEGEYEQGYQKGRQVGLDTGIEMGRGKDLTEIPWTPTRGDEVLFELIAERDTAFAENERLRAERINETGKSAEMYEQLHREVERLKGGQAINLGLLESAKAWRGCADQLAACVNHPFSRWADSSEALAEYERLRRGRP